jgi:hypothetical protein
VLEAVLRVVVVSVLVGRAVGTTPVTELATVASADSEEERGGSSLDAALIFLAPRFPSLCLL